LSIKKSRAACVELISEKMASMRCVFGYFFIGKKSKKVLHAKTFFYFKKTFLDELIETNNK